MSQFLLFVVVLLVNLTPVQAKEYPLEFDHMFGKTEVRSEPKRVVSLGYIGHDNLLALGVVPVALRYWYGDYPNGVWPWAEALLGEQQPIVLSGEISMEQVASLQPDLIIAISSGITAEEYAILSQIAPTIASEQQYGDFNTPWEVQARTIGLAVGRVDEVERQIKTIESSIESIREAHLNWADMTATVAVMWSGIPRVYLPADSRVRLLAEFGFSSTDAVQALSQENVFFATISPEDLTPLEADVLVWLADENGTAEAVQGLALRKSLQAYQAGREVWVDEYLSAALSHASLLSIPEAIERLVPEIEAAVDGDVDTVVPSAFDAKIAP